MRINKIVLIILACFITTLIGCAESKTEKKNMANKEVATKGKKSILLPGEKAICYLDEYREVVTSFGRILSWGEYGNLKCMVIAKRKDFVWATEDKALCENGDLYVLGGRGTSWHHEGSRATVNLYKLLEMDNDSIEVETSVLTCDNCEK